MIYILSDKDIRILAGQSILGNSNSRQAEGDILNIKGFYDQNSHVMPSNLIECKGILSDGIEDSWLEYIPASYNSSNPIPLVISRHGGGQDGWVQCYSTSWIYVAEKEGFIVVFPTLPSGPPPPFGNGKEALLNHPMFCLDPTAHDITMFQGLINLLKTKYNIDENRIYSHGMSMGDLMTMRFARLYGHLLAGIGLVAGPSPIEVLFTPDGQLKKADGAVPCYQARGENDDMTMTMDINSLNTRYDVNKANKDFWIQLNGCQNVPTLRIDGRSNFEFYKGETADVVFRDVKERGHGQTFDDAQFTWDTCFSRYKRVDGRIIETNDTCKLSGDPAAVVIADGCSKAYVKNAVIDMPAPAYQVHDLAITKAPPSPFPQSELIFSPVLYVPVDLLKTAFGCSIEMVQEGQAAFVTTADGRVLEISNGNAGIMIDGHVSSMWRQAETFEGNLMVPFQWFTAEIMGLHVTEHDGSVYASDHYGAMTKYMARTIKEVVLA